MWKHEAENYLALLTQDLEIVPSIAISLVLQVLILYLSCRFVLFYDCCCVTYSKTVKL